MLNHENRGFWDFFKKNYSEIMLKLGKIRAELMQNYKEISINCIEIKHKLCIN